MSRFKRQWACAALGAASVAGAPAPALALAQAPVAPPPAAAASQATTQRFYVLSLTDTPVAEAAEAVIGEALGQAVSVDPTLDREVSFQAEGFFTAEALLQEFGAAVLARDLALIRSRGGDLSVTARTELPAALAQGGTLIALRAPTPSPVASAATRPVTGARPPIVYGRERGRGPALILTFLAGCVAGAGLLFGGQTLWRRRAARSVQVLTVPGPPAETPIREETGDPGLIIPRFDPRPPLH